VPLANLTLRFGATKLRATVRWPAADVRALALVLTDEMGLVGSLLRDCLVVSLLEEHGGVEELSALQWLGDHARELGSGSDHLVVAGGARAACLAVAARDSGWPRLQQQLVMYPRFTAERPVPAVAVGLAPATIVHNRRDVDDGRHYAALLRDAGVPVQELAL
jgi:acetyl esterase/lipase